MAHSICSPRSKMRRIALRDLFLSFRTSLTFKLSVKTLLNHINIDTFDRFRVLLSITDKNETIDPCGFSRIG